MYQQTYILSFLQSHVSTNIHIVILTKSCINKHTYNHHHTNTNNNDNNKHNNNQNHNNNHNNDHINTYYHRVSIILYKVRVVGRPRRGLGGISGPLFRAITSQHRDCVYIHIYIYIYVCMYVCMCIYIYIYIYIYVYMFVCVYIYIYIYIQRL